MRECVEFGERAGFIPPEEAAEAKKIIPLLESGAKTPGNCTRKAACEAYCMEPSHIDECLAFAEKAGLIPPEELADAKRFAPYIKSGETPGGCRRKEECEAYCSDVAHFEECVAFAKKAGMISNEEAELARKIKGKGPGGCTTRDSCEEFCQAPQNQETCITFAKEHGLVEGIAEIEAKVRGEIESKMAACAEKPCAEMISCLQSLQTGAREGGEGSLPAGVKEKLNVCIEEIRAKAIQEAGGGGGQAAPTGPLPPGEAPAGQTSPSEEYQRQYQEEYQKQYQEEYQKQYQEQERQILQQFCPLYAVAPSCSFLGPPDSVEYQRCKQCFPDK
jgi:hypothetical protein